MEIFLRNARISYGMVNNFKTKACDCRALFILSGKGKITLEGKTYPLKENTICYYPAGSEYFPVFSKQEPVTFISYNFDFNRDNSHLHECRKTVRSELFNPEEAIFSQNECEVPLFKTPFVIENFDRFRDLLIKVSEEYKDGMGNEPAASALLQYIFFKLADKRNEDTSSNSLFERAVEYINNHYRTIKDNHEIADALSYHDYYINRIFKINAGMTLHRYILNLRLEKAAKALLENKLSINEVAKSVGFYNADHFSKRFLEKYGMSPSAYRKEKETLQLI